jgi:hypothetical protein
MLDTVSKKKDTCFALLLKIKQQARAFQISYEY